MDETERYRDDEHDEDTGEHAVRVRRGAVPWVLVGVSLLCGAGAALWFYGRERAARLETAAALGAAEAAHLERADLAQRLERLEAEKADLLALKNELSVEVEAKEEELSRLQGTYRELETKMKEEIAKGDVRLSQSGGRIKVDLVDRILFDVGDASVTARGEEVLSRVGTVLANVQDRKIQVSGHTDDLPISDRLRDRYPTNWELAAARASNVVRFLEEKAGVPGRRLVAAAYGPWEPISSNKTASGRARNRRIEIVLTPALAPARIEGAAAAPASVPAARPAAAAAVRPAATPAARPSRAPAKAPAAAAKPPATGTKAPGAAAKVKQRP
jgi:chemotaxis protein MotB